MQAASTVPSTSSWLDKLVAANPSITDRAERHQSRLISVLTLGIPAVEALLLGLILIARPEILDDPDVQLMLTAGPLMLIAYFINRSGHRRTASMTIIVGTALITITAGYLPSAAPRNLILSLLPSLLTALLLSPRTSIIVSVSMAVLLFVINGVHPALPNEFNAYFDTAILLAPIQLVIGLFSYQMQRVEQIRRAELEERNEQLRLSEILLEKRVEERTHELKLTNDKLAVALDQAEEASRLKSQFLASMSHELRTPLNAIINFTQIMVMGVLGELSEKQSSTLNEVIASAKHLLALINDILDISKIQAGMLTLFIEEDVDVNAIVRNVTTTAKTLVGDDKAVEVIEDIDVNLPKIVGDRRRLQQILLNLVSNAAKFTDEGSITVSAIQKDGEITFGVVDTGPGIAEADVERIFAPFEQTDAGARVEGGTGLGLSITRNLVNTHEGRLWVESTPGKGSSFFFTIPVASETLRAQIA